MDYSSPQPSTAQHAQPATLGRPVAYPQPYPTYAAPRPTYTQPRPLTDFNRDGIPDQWQPTVLPDLNRDGIPDAVQRPYVSQQLPQTRYSTQWQEPKNWNWTAETNTDDQNREWHRVDNNWPGWSTWGSTGNLYPRAAADWNGDGKIDATDYAIQNTAWRAPTTTWNQAAPIRDWNNDGRIDGTDARIQGSLSRAYNAPGTQWASAPVRDWNGDGVINSDDWKIQEGAADINRATWAFGNAPVYDWDGDGYVDIVDYQIQNALATQWRAAPTTQWVQPSTDLYDNYGNLIVQDPYVQVHDADGDRQWDEENTYAAPQTTYQPATYQPHYSQPIYSQPTYAQPTYAQPTYAQPAYTGKTYATYEEALAAQEEMRANMERENNLNQDQTAAESDKRF